MSRDIINDLTEVINETVAHFASQKIVVDLWSTEKQDSATADAKADATIQKFYIKKPDGRSEITDEASIGSAISLINTQSSALSDAIGDILDENEDQVQKDIIEALDIILTQVDGFKKSFESRIAKFKKECERDEATFSKKKQLFEDLVQKSFSALIDETLSAVYRGIKITSNPIYDLVLSEINSFLKNVGVSTVEVKLGTKINFDFCRYADELVAVTGIFTPT